MRLRSPETQRTIARCPGHAGNKWSILILRHPFGGATCFGQFQKSPGIASKLPTRPVVALIKAEMFERDRYSKHPPHEEHRETHTLTDCIRQDRASLRPLHTPVFRPARAEAATNATRQRHAERSGASPAPSTVPTTRRVARPTGGAHV